MSLWGHGLLWWALAAWVGVVGLFVVFSIGYFCCVDRWCDRRAARTRNRS